MSHIESAVARHYGDAQLLERILSGLEASGVDLDRVAPEDLEAVEEFHIGGRQATAYALSKMTLSGDQQVLDIGCGIGGAARYIAAQTGCNVTGIDLTPEYIATAKELTALTGLGEKVSFELANALAMPFSDRHFDAAITLHVAMNIAERERLYGEIARVLEPGATFCLFDVMKKSEEGLAFPVPWAQSQETSHLTTPEQMCSLLEEAGFELRESEDRSEFASDFFARSMAGMADGPHPLGIHLLLGPSAAEKFMNTMSNIQKGRIAPVQMVAVRKG